MVLTQKQKSAVHRFYFYSTIYILKIAILIANCDFSRKVFNFSFIRKFLIFIKYSHKVLYWSKVIAKVLIASDRFIKCYRQPTTKNFRYKPPRAPRGKYPIQIVHIKYTSAIWYFCTWTTSVVAISTEYKMIPYKKKLLNFFVNCSRSASTHILVWQKNILLLRNVVANGVFKKGFKYVLIAEDVFSRSIRQWSIRQNIFFRKYSN